jgi:hypothetical protein
MRNTFRSCAFFTAIFTIFFYLGHMVAAALLFLGLTGFLLTVGYSKVSERMSAYIFGALLMVFFVGFTYYTTFIMPVSNAGH